MHHLSDTIRAIRAKRLELARVDPRSGMPIVPPPAAAPAAIALAERRLGFGLPPSYRAFLELSDGWPKLFHGTSLFGAQTLARGTYVRIARMMIEEHSAPLEQNDFASGSASSVLSGSAPGSADSSFVPFGIDPDGETVVGWDTASAGCGGELPVTLWINGICDVVDSFPSFLTLVLEMLAAEVEERRGRTRGVGDRGSVSPAMRPMGPVAARRGEPSMAGRIHAA